uniref:KH-like RNA-binding domain-containing protein n=1 Tax=Oryctolagus cuniculus TaxID=9986 RepID=G1TCH5_RABIT
MDADVGAAEARQDPLKPARPEDLLKFPHPPPPPRIHIRPWWFPEQELEDPLVFHLEAWVADMIFGPDRARIPEMEWMSQALLRVDRVDFRNLVESTVHGRPRVRNRVKSILLSLASWHRERRARRAEKMKHLEEFLKTTSDVNVHL